MLKSEVIDKIIVLMHCIMQNWKKTTVLHIVLSSRLNIGHCVELALFEGKLISYFNFLKMKFLKNLLHFESDSKSRFNSDENWV